jgi:hypothetical protein
MNSEQNNAAKYDELVLRKIEALRIFIKSRLINPEQESITCSFTELILQPLLSDQMGLEILLNLLQEKTDGKISWQSKTVLKKLSILGKFNGSSYEMRELPGFTLHMENPNKIDIYFDSVLEKLHSNSKDNKVKKTYKNEITVGKLKSGTDGLIRFGENVVELRPQLNTLCRMFMQNVGSLLDIDTIKEELISSDKQPFTSNSTLAKYVSELQKKLKSLYGSKVIFSVSKSGWMFDPNSINS